MRPVRAIGLGILGSLLAYGAGFGWFVRDAERTSPWPANADGIVALTGGTLRVETALMLLRAGVAHRLLISGAGAGVTLPDVLHQDRVGAGAITLGHGARTTLGNAVETTWWVRANDLHSLVVVTAGYHMRRALEEIRTAAPDVRLTAYAVHPGAGLRLLLVEYAKLVATEFGLDPSARPAETA